MVLLSIFFTHFPSLALSALDVFMTKSDDETLTDVKCNHRSNEASYFGFIFNIFVLVACIYLFMFIDEYLILDLFSIDSIFWTKTKYEKKKKLNYKICIFDSS